MLQIIGSFLDNLIFILLGILFLTKLKIINKPYLKWLAIVLIAMGLVLTAIDIYDLVE